VRGLVVHQDARYARDLELRIAHDFYSLAINKKQPHFFKYGCFIFN